VKKRSVRRGGRKAGQTGCYFGGKVGKIGEGGPTSDGFRDHPEGGRGKKKLRPRRSSRII